MPEILARKRLTQEDDEAKVNSARAYLNKLLNFKGKLN